jgi:cation transport ATPase
MALWAALGRASSQQVLFRDLDALTRLASVRVMCFDKTGTLTTGEPQVEEFHVADENVRDRALTAAAALANCSTHGFSSAICQFANLNQHRYSVDVRVLPGRGLVGNYADEHREIYLGSARLMEEAGLEYAPQLKVHLTSARRIGRPVTCIGWDGQVHGVFSFREQLRPAVKETVRWLQDAGIHVVMLTGDESVRASHIKAQLNIEVHSGLLPEEKFMKLGELRRRFGPVAMVGDGINDAPALAAADVGIAMGCGADVSRDAADVCLLGDDLHRLPWVLQLVRRTVNAIRINLFWAFFYNSVGVILAAAGWMNPILAAIAMVGSSLLVISNSLRIAVADTRCERVEIAEQNHGEFNHQSSGDSGALVVQGQSL